MVLLVLKRRLGKGAFALTALGSMRNYVPQPFRLRLDGEGVTGTFAVIANSPRYGGGFRFCPDARLEDPFLQVCVFQVDRAVYCGRYGGGPGRPPYRHRELRADGLRAGGIQAYRMRGSRST